MLRGLSPAIAMALLALIVVVGGVALYIIVEYAAHKVASSGREELNAVRVVGVLPLKIVATPSGRSYLATVLVEGLLGRSVRIDRVYIVNPYSHTAIYAAKPLRPIELRPHEIANVSFLIPANVMKKVLKLSLARIVLASSSGGIEASMNVVPSKLIESAPPASRVQGLVGFKFVVINCSDAESWWVNVSQIVDIIEHTLSRYYYVKMIIINSTEQLYRFIENPSNFSGENWDGAIVIDAHGEVVPIPSQFINGTTVNWKAWYSQIVKAIEGHGLVWVSVVGYPFYYVSNTGAGIGRYVVGPQGIQYVLNDTSANCFSGDEWRIMIGPRSYHDFLNNSVEVSLTSFGKGVAELYQQLFGSSIPSTLRCARALYTASTNEVLYSVYENSSRTIPVKELIAFDDFTANTLNPLTVEPQGDVYWWYRGSYAVSASTLELYPGSAVIRADIGWDDTIHAYSTNSVGEVDLELNASSPLPTPSSVYALSVYVPNNAGIAEPLTLVEVKDVAIPPSYATGFEAFLNVSNYLVEVPTQWNCSSSGVCNISILLRELPATGARIVIVAGVKARNYGLWSLGGNATITNGVVQLVPEAPSAGGRAMLVYTLPPSDSRLVISFDYEFVNNADGRADGFAVAFFVNNETVPNIWSSRGGDLGFGTNVKGYAIEFDLYHNSFDPQGMHVALIEGSVANHLVYDNSTSIQTTVFSAGVWHRCRIVIDASTGVEVFVDGVEVLHYSGALTRFGNIVFISGATGGDYDGILIKNATVYSNVVVVSPSSVHVLGSATLAQSIDAVDFLAKSLGGGYGYRVGAVLGYGYLGVGGSRTPIGFVKLVYRYVDYVDRSLNNESVTTFYESPLPIDLQSFAAISLVVEKNSVIRVCIGSACATYTLSSIDASPEIAIYDECGGELLVGWVRDYELYPSFTGPRFCGAVIPLGKGYLVLNGWSPPNNVSKEYGYSYSGIEPGFVARMAVAVPVQLMISRG